MVSQQKNKLADDYHIRYWISRYVCKLISLFYHVQVFKILLHLSIICYKMLKYYRIGDIFNMLIAIIVNK